MSIEQEWMWIILGISSNKISCYVMLCYGVTLCHLMLRRYVMSSYGTALRDGVHSDFCTHVIVKYHPKLKTSQNVTFWSATWKFLQHNWQFTMKNLIIQTYIQFFNSTFVKKLAQNGQNITFVQGRIGSQ